MMIRNAFVVMMSVAGAAAAATALVALGWWNVRGEQAPVTAFGITLLLIGSATCTAALGCRLYPKSESRPATSVVTAAGPGS